MSTIIGFDLGVGAYASLPANEDHKEAAQNYAKTDPSAFDTCMNVEGEFVSFN